MSKLLHFLDRLNKYIGQIAIWLLPAMICLAFTIVVLRYGFNYGRVDMQEGVVYLHVFILTLCMGYTMRFEGHVRVDVFYSKMSEKTKANINLLGDLLFLLPTCAAIVFYSIDYVAVSWRLLEHSQEAAGLPLIFILKTLIPVMASLLFWQGMLSIVRQVYLSLCNKTQTPTA